LVALVISHDTSFKQKHVWQPDYTKGKQE